MITPPSRTTLRKYGMEESEWRMMLFLQAERCPICHRKFDEKIRPVVDHIHVRGFRRMKPEDKKKYVRGITCLYCNFRRLPKGTTLETARAVVDYLEAYEARLNLAET